MIFPRLLSLALCLLPSAVFAERFTIERMPDPEGVDPQIGGVAALEDGRLAVVFHRGELMLFDPATRAWSPFASGLHEPLGIVADGAADFTVIQRAELTRIRDTTGDGLADDYETVFDGFGMSGNYHEFAFGLARCEEGWFHIGLGLASNGAGTREEIRGEWSEIGRLNRAEMVHDSNWGQRSARAGRMYARVPWRGWVLRISPDGSEMEPLASGFRSPEGLGFDHEGNLFVTDNEGDWRGTSPLHHVTRGGFYGHPASLVWREDWDAGDPLELPVSTLQDMRTPETARFPQGDLANSPTEPLAFPETWPAYHGQMLIGEMNQPRMVRYLPDVVDGFRQGALAPMFDGTALGNGNHRHAFTPDGSLWVGKTHLSWAGAEGLFRISPPDFERLFTTRSIRLLPGEDGRHVFEISFNRPAAPPESIAAIRHYDYHYHVAYGSPKIEQGSLEADSWSLSADGLVLRIETSPRLGHVHQIDLRSMRSLDGEEIEGRSLFYQVSRLP